MDTLLTKLNDELEALKDGVQSRRRARRDWMERLMRDRDPAADTNTGDGSTPQTSIENARRH